MSSWFRDYVYFPLGGSRYGVTLTCRNILFVFVITGLWHGAAWTFLLWGLYHGTFMLIERLAFGNPREVLRQHVLRYAYALPVILFGWVMFRSVTVSQALNLWGAMTNPLANGALDLNQIARLGTWQNMLGILVGSLIFVLPGKTSWTSPHAGADGRPRRLAEYRLCRCQFCHRGVGLVDRVLQPLPIFRF